MTSAMELLSGILLAIVLVATVGYLVKEMFGERVKHSFTEYSQRPTRTPNDRLVGAVGTIVSPAGPDRLQGVRIGMERWKARVAAAPEGFLPVGSKVIVTRIEGLVLDVEAAAEEAPPRSVENDGVSG